jgi:RNA polymerase sigma-70 factor (ECF subfamily)
MSGLAAFTPEPAPLSEREVCRRLLPAMRAFAQRRLPSALAEDLVQDALVILIDAMRSGQIDDPARTAGFALGICRNLARTRARSGERRRDLLERFQGELELVISGEPSPVRRDQLEDCYSQLTERARRIIRATFCEDDSDSEIAAALSLTESNVRVIRHRTLAALRTCLERPISWEQR